MKNKGLVIRFLQIIFVMALVFSCGKSADKQTENPNTDTFHLTDTVSGVYENPKITEFKTFVSQLDSSDVTSATKAMEKYKEIFTGQSTLLCDTGFVIFQALYDTLEMNLSNLHQNDTTNYEPLLSGDQSAVPKNLKDYNNKLKINGFKIASTEGVTYIEQDRNFIARNFNSLVTPVMKDYLTELQKENKEGFAVEGVITISPRQLVDRNVWYEKFVYENPGFVFIQNCKDYQKAYLTYLMCGYEDTKLYANDETKELSGFYVDAYNYLSSKYSGSQTAQTVLPYYEALKQKQTANAQSILKGYHIKGMIYSVK